MTNTRILQAALALAPVLMPAATVTNGDFETGNLTGWTLSNSSIYDKVCLSGSTVGAAVCSVHGGSYAMTFGHAGTTTGLAQTIATTAGQAYDISFYLAVATPTSSGTESFELLWDGTSVFALVNPSAAFSYGQRIVTNLVATSASTVLEFRARHDPSQWFLDDVTVTEAVPEPGSVALVLSGTALLAWRRIAQSASARKASTQRPN